jgi:hypothetical protein
LLFGVPLLDLKSRFCAPPTRSETLHVVEPDATPDFDDLIGGGFGGKIAP